MIGRIDFKLSEKEETIKANKKIMLDQNNYILFLQAQNTILQEQNNLIKEQNDLLKGQNSERGHRP